MNRTSGSVVGNVRMFDCPSWISVAWKVSDLSGRVAERLAFERVEAGRIEDRHIDAAEHWPRRPCPTATSDPSDRRSRIEVGVLVEDQRLTDCHSYFALNCQPPRMAATTAIPVVAPLCVRGPNGSSATLASVMRCGRSTAPTRLSGSSHGLSGATCSRKRDQVYEHSTMRPSVNRLSSAARSARDRCSSVPSRCRTCSLPVQSVARSADTDSSNRRRAMVAPLLAGRVWRQPRRTDSRRPGVRNISAVVSRSGLCRAEMLRHVVELLQHGQVAAASGPGRTPRRASRPGTGARRRS